MNESIDSILLDISNNIKFDIKTNHLLNKNNNLCLFIIGCIYNINIEPFYSYIKELLRSSYNVSVIALVSYDLSPNCLSPNRLSRKSQIKTTYIDDWNKLLKMFCDNNIRYIVETYSSEKDLSTEDYPNIKKYIKNSSYNNSIIHKKDSIKFQIILELITFSILEEYELDNNIYFNRFIKIRPDCSTSDFIFDKISNLDIFKDTHFQFHDVFYITNRDNLEILKYKVMYFYHSSDHYDYNDQERFKCLELIYKKDKDKFLGRLDNLVSDKSIVNYYYNHFINIFILEYYNKKCVVV